jgi:hypothetical protein
MSTGLGAVLTPQNLTDTSGRESERAVDAADVLGTHSKIA